ncbi:hypothetical protein NQ318_003508, partial [Aromia moschata]
TSNDRGGFLRPRRKHPAGREQPVSAVPVSLFSTRLTAVVATSDRGLHCGLHRHLHGASEKEIENRRRPSPPPPPLVYDEFRF